MAGVEVKSFDAPDETRPFTDKGQADVVPIGGGTVLRGTFEPGWRWSDHVKPIAGPESCQSPHSSTCFPGVVRIELGHDAWVVGEEAGTIWPCASFQPTL